MSSAEMFNSFHYQPLNPAIHEIRLLSLQPSAVRSSPLVLTISHAALKTACFVALSYTWGKEPPSDEIHLNNCSVKITPNLFAALKELALRFDAPITIWVDAICINQDDEAEKDYQIGMMTELYRTAKQTFIWLGTEDENTRLLFDVMDRMGAAAINAGINNLDFNDAKIWPDLGPEKANERHALLNLLQRTKEFPVLNLRDLFRSKWFGRVWIVQEYSVSKKVDFVCGSKIVDGDRFAAASAFSMFWIWYRFAPLRTEGSHFITWAVKAVRAVWRLLPLFKDFTEQRPEERALSVLGMRRYFEEKNDDAKHSELDLTLMRLLTRAFVKGYNFKPLKSSEPKDRIYAFLAISSDGETLGIQPNHRMTYQRLYAQTAKALIYAGNLDVLSLCRLQSRGRKKSERDPQLPSWSPDWNARIRRPWGGLKADKLFNASRRAPGIRYQSTKQITQGLNWNYLELEATLVGTVAKVGTPWRLVQDRPNDLNHEAAHTLFTEVAAFIEESRSTYTDSDKQEAVWRIPVVDKGSEAFSITCRLGPEAGATYKAHQKIRKFVAPQRRKATKDFLYWAQRTSYWQLLDDLYDAKPMLVDTGHVGICPNCTQERDQIWIPNGAHVPYVLRKDDDDTSRLIGETYVHGIMDGEFFKQERSCQVIRLV